MAQATTRRAGSEIGLRMLDQVLATDNQAVRHKLFTAAMVLCSGEPHPRDAFAGLATVVAPALQRTPEPDKSLANLAARAALAGHVCTRDANGAITLARWGRSMTFDNVQDAESWLARVVGKRGEP